MIKDTTYAEQAEVNRHHSLVPKSRLRNSVTSPIYIPLHCTWHVLAINATRQEFLDTVSAIMSSRDALGNQEWNRSVIIGRLQRHQRQTDAEVRGLSKRQKFEIYARLLPPDIPVRIDWNHVSGSDNYKDAFARLFGTPRTTMELYHLLRLYFVPNELRLAQDFERIREQVFNGCDEKMLYAA